MPLYFERTWIALTLLWAPELFAVQEISLIAPHAQTAVSVFTDTLIRFSLNLIACGSILHLLPRIARRFLFIVNPLFYLAVLIYRDYFNRSLSVFVVRNNGGEGADVTDAMLALLEPWQLVFLVTLAAKLLLLARVHTDPRRRTGQRATVGAVGVALYLCCIGLFNVFAKPMWKLERWGTVGGVGSVYGYLPTWAAEWYFIDHKEVLRRALARADAGTSDILSPVETAPPMHPRIVFVQVGSLDAALIGFRIDGLEVTPHLNALARRSMYYRVQADKRTGSSDSDFVALMAKLSSDQVPNYKIPNYPLTGSLPQRLNAKGYRTSAIHGVSGEFFNRRPAFESMQFDEIIFKEEFVQAGVRADNWTVHDRKLFDLAGEKLTATQGPHFMLVITATTHIPYPCEDGSPRVFFPSSRDHNESYFDSFHQVDAIIGGFIAALPPATTLILYGDHISQVRNPDIGYVDVQPPTGNRQSSVEWPHRHASTYIHGRVGPHGRKSGTRLRGTGSRSRGRWSKARARASRIITLEDPTSRRRYPRADERHQTFRQPDPSSPPRGRYKALREGLCLTGGLHVPVRRCAWPGRP